MKYAENCLANYSMLTSLAKVAVYTYAVAPVQVTNDVATTAEYGANILAVDPKDIEVARDSKYSGGVVEKDQAFSLLELLIVVAIILIIATIAIPSLLRSRQAAQEASAVAQIRTINTAQVTYLSSSQGNFGNVPQLITAGLLDSRFAAGGGVSGYSFTVTASGSNYTASAYPTSANSGRFGYFSLPDAVIRYAASTAANCIPCFPGGMSGQPVQ